MRNIADSCIRTTHQLARELLSEPDGFITILIGEDECMVEKIKTIRTHANLDDGVVHKALICKKMEGILR